MKFGKGFKDLISDIVNESLTETFGDILEGEEQLQKSTEKELKPFKHREKKAGEINDEQDDPIEPSDSDDKIDPTDGEVEMKVLTPEELQEVDVERIIDEINTMRSGESLKDADVRSQISSYFDVLNPTERKMLFSFLQGLAQIMSFGAPGTKAARPATYKLKAEEMVKPEQEKSEEGGDKKPSSPPAEKQKEKSQGPAPIVVGEAADKSFIKKRLRELMKR